MDLQVCQPGCSSSQTCNQCDTFSKQVETFCNYLTIFGCASLDFTLVSWSFGVSNLRLHVIASGVIMSLFHHVIMLTCQLLTTFLNPWKFMATLGNPTFWQIMPMFGNFLLMFGHFLAIFFYLFATFASIGKFC